MLEENVVNKIKELDGYTMQKKGRLLQFWGKSLNATNKNNSSQSSKRTVSAVVVDGSTEPISKTTRVENQVACHENTVSPTASSSGLSKRPAPAQIRSRIK